MTRARHRADPFRTDREGVSSCSAAALVVLARPGRPASPGVGRRDRPRRQPGRPRVGLSPSRSPTTKARSSASRARRSASSASRPPTRRSRSRWARATAWWAAPTPTTTRREAAGLPDVVEPDEACSLEQIVALEPDLVLASRQRLHAACRHRAAARAGLPGAGGLSPRRSTRSLADIRLIGEAAGRAARQPTRWRPSMAAAPRHGGGRRGDATGERAAHLLRDRLRPRASTARPPAPSYADMIELAGGEPITTADPSVYSIPLERLVDGRPGGHRPGRCASTGRAPPRSLARPGWGGMTAVAQRRRPARQRHDRHPPGAAARRRPRVPGARHPSGARAARASPPIRPCAPEPPTAAPHRSPDPPMQAGVPSAR